MESEIIKQHNLSSVTWDEQYFKFCEFDGFSIEGETVSSDFNSCRFKDLDWYWGLFTLANFINCKFVNCTFRGTSFTDSRFIECEFTNCQFVKDNLNGECNFSGAVAYGCKIENCNGFAIRSLCKA
jgi:uncharacterized protein YjbI with pentapeptide repeats